MPTPDLGPACVQLAEQVLANEADSALHRDRVHALAAVIAEAIEGWCDVHAEHDPARERPGGR
jgi:hypothetical protein